MQPKIPFRHPVRNGILIICIVLPVLPPHIALRICSEELFICPEKGGVVAEAAAEVDIPRRLSGGEKGFCTVEALYADVFADGVTGCLLDNAA